MTVAVNIIRFVIKAILIFLFLLVAENSAIPDVAVMAITSCPERSVFEPVADF